MDRILQRLMELFSPERIIDYLAVKLLPDLFISLITFVAFYLVWKGSSKVLRLVLGRIELDQTAQRFAQTVTKYVILTIGFVTALSQMGINMASIVTSLGVAGLTIGFAAKDALSNIISGLFIFWDRPFVIGDLVEIGGEYGRVEEITMRSTRVVTVDGRMLAIPNNQVVNTAVTSYTNFPHLRLDVQVTVGTGEDLGKIRKLLLNIFKDDERYMDAPKPEVVVSALNDFNVELTIRAWIENERNHIPMRFELREKIFDVLRDAGVEMPFETFDINMKNKVT